MSSLFTEAEIQLAKLGLAKTKGDQLNVVVGGLGLGYSAAAALEDDRVNSLIVIDVMQPVIDWHERALVPLGKQLTDDSRVEFIHADFFKLAHAGDCGFNTCQPNELADAILLDIDHSPSHWLNQGNSQFYSEHGLKKLSTKLRSNGVFGLWSNDPPDDDFVALLESTFESVDSHIVSFDNPYTDKQSTNTVYLAIKK